MSGYLGTTDRFVPVAPAWWVANLGGVALTGVLAARARGPVRRPVLRSVFAAAVALHIGEAVYAYRSASDAGFHESAPRWALQTLGVGFPSLLALRKARHDARGERGQ